MFCPCTRVQEACTGVRTVTSKGSQGHGRGCTCVPCFLCLHIQYNIVSQIFRDAINTDPSTDMRPMKTRIINIYCSLRVTTANRNPEDRMPHTDGEPTVAESVFGDNRIFPFYPADAESTDTSESLFCITVACSAPVFSRNPRLKLQNIAPFKRRIHSVRIGTQRYRFQYRKRGV